MDERDRGGNWQSLTQIRVKITLKLSRVPQSCITISVHCPIYPNYTFMVVGRIVKFCRLLWKLRLEYEVLYAFDGKRLQF